MNDIKPFLMMMVEHDASDMILTAHMKPHIKIEGILRPANAPQLADGETNRLALSIMSEAQSKALTDTKECNLALSVEGIGRFRVNLYYQRGEISIAIRRIKMVVPDLEHLGVPKQAEKLAMLKRGLVLITGMAGSGKSTTLAAMIAHRAKHIGGHILTIEDPIEFILPHGRALVEQREVGFDTNSFADALQNVLREAVDVIVIGEIRDMETAKQAIAYADGGSLCLSTMHSNNAHQAIDRLLNFFPAESHPQVLMDLSLNLRGVISQRLIPSKGKLVLATEVMMQSAFISDIIVNGRINELKDAMKKSTEEGMQIFDDSLFALYKAGLITLEEAMENADSQADLSVRIRLEGWHLPV